MRRTFPGELEEVVLLVVAARTEDRYGVSIQEQLQEQTGRAIPINAVHATLYRLEERATCLLSWVGQRPSEVAGVSASLR